MKVRSLVFLVQIVCLLSVSTAGFSKRGEKNFKLEDPNDLSQRVGMMKDVIDQLNAMLKSVSSDPALSYVHYIDLRGTLSNDLQNDAYKEWWANELHPTEQGFEKVTQKFDAELRALP